MFNNVLELECHNIYKPVETKMKDAKLCTSKNVNFIFYKFYPQFLKELQKVRERIEGHLFQKPDIKFIQKETENSYRKDFAGSS